MLGFRPISAGALSEIRDAQVTQTSTATLRYASRTFVTRTTDAPAQVVIPGRIAAGLRLERRLSTAADGQFGAIADTNYGEIQLNNADGQLDSLATRYAADGRQIRLKIGSTEIDSAGRERVQPFAQFATVYISTAGAWNFEHNVLRLRVESLINRLQGRLQPETYAGTGGADGTADMAGRAKPTLFGRGSNITLQLLDPAILTYQLHAGAIDSISAVYDAGISIDFYQDYATYAELEASDISTVVVNTETQLYASCLAAGVIRLGVSPVGAVTADARGHLDNLTGNFNQTTASLIRTILRDYAAIAASEIDQAAFDAFVSLQSGAIGLFLPAGDQSTVVDVVQRIAFGAGAFVGEQAGQFTIQRLDPPSATVVHWAFDDRDIISIERLTLPYSVPWKSWGVGYALNSTVQANADLAGAVTQERRTYLQAERRYAYTQNSNIALFHATSRGAPLRESYFVDAAVAQAEAERLIGLYAYGRALYRVVVKSALFSVHLGQTVRLTYRRWGLDGGRNFVVVGVDDDADTVESGLTVFG
jgi:hypothetical protein